jgi:hypothetical protein
MQPPTQWVLVALSLGMHKADTDFHLVLRLRMGEAHSPTCLCVKHRDFTFTFLLAGVEEKGI